MTREQIVEAANAKIRKYAKVRYNAVFRGKETNELAALLLQKYAAGVQDGAQIALDVLEGNGAPLLRGDVLGEEVEKIDPQWKEHGRLRGVARNLHIRVIQ